MENGITKEGYEALEKELLYLRTEKRKEVEYALREASEFGDLRENSEYDAALLQQTNLERRIQELERGLARAKIIRNDRYRVGIGSTVTVCYLEDNTLEKYTIVNPLEVDILHNKISLLSPIGEKVIGAKVGDILEIKNNDICYKIKIVELQ